ncbi:MAG: hypothetical protein ACPGTU_12990, partial [Myxococcota bacterium]
MYRIMLAVLATLFMGSVSTEAFAQDAEEATEEVSENTETNEEVSQEETEVESTSEDVLSQ